MKCKDGPTDAYDVLVEMVSKMRKGENILGAAQETDWQQDVMVARQEMLCGVRDEDVI